MKETYEYYNNTIKSNYPGIALDPVAESKMLTQLYQRINAIKGDETHAPKKTTNT
jgi:hypothetical protein